MDKQEQVAAETTPRIIIIPADEQDGEPLNFKTLLERFYLAKSLPANEGKTGS